MAWLEVIRKGKPTVCPGEDIIKDSIVANDDSYDRPIYIPF